MVIYHYKYRGDWQKLLDQDQTLGCRQMANMSLASVHIASVQALGGKMERGARGVCVGLCLFPWSTPREAKKQPLSGSAATSRQQTWPNVPSLGPLSSCCTHATMSVQRSLKPMSPHGQYMQGASCTISKGKRVKSL